MCRFLLLKSTDLINPKEWLKEFSRKCQDSKEYQGDGWGISWLDSDGHWQLHKSVQPIWESLEQFNLIPFSHAFAIHARSASKDAHKGIIEHNQPYISNNYSFVSNVSIRGMKMEYPVKGDIGSQKIFNMLNAINSQNLFSDICEVTNIIRSSATFIRGCNIGLVTSDNVYVSCNYGEDPDYFNLHYFKTNEVVIVCSVPLNIGGFNWETIKNGEALKL